MYNYYKYIGTTIADRSLIYRRVDPYMVTLEYWDSKRWTKSLNYYFFGESRFQNTFQEITEEEAFLELL